MPRINPRDVQDYYDEVSNDGRRPQKIRKPAAWDDRNKNIKSREQRQRAAKQR
jgi:hypothetical protein